VLALPFTTLREVDYRGAGLSAAKDTAIRRLGMATNAKLTLQLARRTWRADGYDGYVETGLIPGDTWDRTVNQPGRSGILVVYSGGTRGVTYPTGRAHLVAWVHDPWSRGSYAAFLVGRYTRFGPHVRAGREGGVHFACEHTDTAQQGYIDGVVRSGERAARKVVG
jgi:monoamine oxidase